MHDHGKLEIVSIIIETAKVTGLVFLFMIIVEFIELKYSNFLKKYLTQNKHLQYIISSFFGIIPGCSGTFAMDSMYMSGIIGFGGIIAVMVSTFGDEAFVLLAQSPKTALILMGFTFFLGIIAGYLADYSQKIFKFKFNEKCCITHHEGHEHHFSLKHFFKEHIWTHIFKKHIPSIFFWLLFSILIIAFLNEHIHLDEVIKDNKWYLLILAALVGILPVSGPNLLFMTMYLEGIAPFSVLLTSSIVQDGHGLLPILGYSLEDAFKIKAFNVVFGLAVGIIVMLLGF